MGNRSDSLCGRSAGKILAAAACGFALSTAQAQQAAPAPDAQDPIVITGTALSEEEARERATAFVRGTGVAAGEEAVARWLDPVCPQVVGLREDQALAVVARMRALAAEAGITVARESCEANIVVSFTADAGAVVREINRRSPARLAEVPVDARTALLEGSAPIRWWYVTETRDRYGARSEAMPVPQSEQDMNGGGSGVGGSILPGDKQTMMRYESSMISTAAQRALTSASVVVDADGVRGRSLDTIAAYAALVAFAEIRRGDTAPEGSILSLFTSPAPPRELTAQDLSFLRALYRLQLDRQARRHRNVLVREMTAALTSEQQTSDQP